MKTIKYNHQLVFALHLLFWVISFNLFNSFFGQGVESGYVVSDLDLTGGNVLLICNIIIAILLVPFTWFFGGIKRWIKWGISIATVLATAGMVILSFNGGENNLLAPIIIAYFLYNFLYVTIFHITIIGAVYFNLSILINQFLNKSRFGIYLLLALGLAIVAGCLNYALFDLFIDKLFPQFFYISWFKVWELILIMTSYLAITTAFYLLWQYGRMLITNREKVRNELSALKAQINPHFLFNNLNTIYDLADKGDVRTKEVILQLSDFLRYVLYDTSSEKISLEKEIEIIKTYVGLQKERINKNTTDVVLNIEGDFAEAHIAPLLLLPLAENCFKHGIGNRKGTLEIDIKFSGHQLNFRTKNRIERRENPLNHEDGGIGILNVEKRLNLLYPNKHQLKFEESEDLFIVELSVILD